jgi:hypothetical protein
MTQTDGGTLAVLEQRSKRCCRNAAGSELITQAKPYGIAGKWKASVVVKLKLVFIKALDVAISGSILY